MERYNCVTGAIEMVVRIDLNMSKSIEKAFRTDITVSQPREIALGETLLCHSQ